MKKRNYEYVVTVLTMLAALLMAGCGSSVSEKSVNTTVKLVPASTEFANASLLVTAASVQEYLGKGGLVIIDARGAGYDTAHIPGAISMKFGNYFTPGVGLKDSATLESMLSTAGLTRDARIVIYDDTTASWGAAGRIFWMLEYLGCTDVHIMNGGWDKWVADGRPAQTTAVSLPPAMFKSQVKSSLRATSGLISNRYQDSNFAVIDSRTDEEFVGWQLYGEARGGHVPGAVNIPYAWFYNSDKTTISYQSLKSMLESRGITTDKEVTAYCTAGIRSGYVYFLLRLMGYTRCSNYDGSMFEWSANPALPMEKAANYTKMVYAGWVQSLIGGTAPANFPAGNSYRILECGWGPTSQDYNNGHIPGAVHFDTNNVEARDYLNPLNPFPVSDANEIVWDLVDDAILEARIARMGISNTTTVIVYGSSAIATTRVYWALRYAGLDVRFLDGGYAAWIGNGGAAETVANISVPAFFTINPQTQFKALTPEIKGYADYFRANSAQQPGTVVVDVRSKDEYMGAVVGYNDPNITRKGRIPGAVWAYDADDASPYYRDADGTLRSYTEIRKIWQDRGITSDKTIIFYCGTGWRSTLAFFYADLMGFSNIKNYDSWYVYSTYWNSSAGTIQRNAPYNDPLMSIDTGWPGP
jgi:thiosulfate/3-mercaptopyruvate sulfurtransferase